MINSWLPILQGLSLSRAEREVVRRFEQDPEGRSFLPVADILRAHRLQDEALELLTQGVEKHPGFTVARVCLARDLLQKGLVEAAAKALDDTPVSLKENLLAQKLKFRLALLLGRDDVARQSLLLLKSNQALDPETKQIADTVDLLGPAAAREKLMADLRLRGTELTLPESPSASVDASGGQTITLSKHGDLEDLGDVTDLSHVEASTHVGSGFLDEDIFSADGKLAGFHVVPLDEIFRPDISNRPAIPGQSAGNGIELDSTTLADIYERQGHYTKALAVYRRLLRGTPNSDLLRRKVADLSRLEKEQRDSELTVDPALVDKLETLEIIDRQIRFYNDLLSRLS